MTEQPTEHDLQFRIWYSYWLEMMVATSNRRVDTVINTVMLVLGSGVFVQSQLSWLFGGVIAVLSGCRIAWKFAQKAEAAAQQARRYSALIDVMAGLGVDEICQRLSMIQEFDSQVLGSMVKPARQKACIAMGLAHRETLSFTEKVTAALTGGIPD